MIYTTDVDNIEQLSKFFKGEGPAPGPKPKAPRKPRQPKAKPIKSSTKSVQRKRPASRSDDESDNNESTDSEMDIDPPTKSKVIKRNTGPKSKQPNSQRSRRRNVTTNASSDIEISDHGYSSSGTKSKTLKRNRSVRAKVKKNVSLFL
jgi:hypothetical protein